MRNKMRLQIKKLEVVKLNNNNSKDVNQVDYFNQAFKMLNWKPCKLRDDVIQTIVNISSQIHYALIKQEYSDISDYKKYRNYIFARNKRIEELQELIR